MAIRWNLLQPNNDKVDALCAQLKIDRILCQLLVLRGIDTFEEAKKFFRHDIGHLHDPYLMNDMALAVDRIELAIKENQHIMVYGDYDVDGTTSVALMYGFINNFYNNISYYIPNRYLEGYGVSIKGMDVAHERKAGLIICLDCGITAIEQVNYAKEKGIDFIICDHHRPSEILPNAVAILNPKRLDNTYPYAELSGCGIGFKLIQGFAQKNNMPFEQIAPQLDLVAISIASDIVPLTGENRTLAHFGLQLLNTKPRMSLKVLLDLCKIMGEITITTLVFVLGPRINAAGRMEEGSDAVKLLIANNYDAAYEQAHLLQSHNVNRKEFDKDITESALAILANSPQLQNKKTTVLASEGWHKGVIGIVASRVMEKYYRPTIIMSQNDGTLVGSVRSVRNFDVYEALTKCSHLLDKFGGHKYAAGVSLKTENLAAFTNCFEKVVADTITPDDLIQQIEIDAELPLEKVNANFYNILKQMAPFGPGNMTPVFITKNLKDTGNSKIAGQKHLKISLKDTQNKTINGIGFDMEPYLKTIKEQENIDMLYSIYENEWNGHVTLEARVRALSQNI
jgi:single-stranded-DNA-specific exonuclease